MCGVGDPDFFVCCSGDGGECCAAGGAGVLGAGVFGGGAGLWFFDFECVVVFVFFQGYGFGEVHADEGLELFFDGVKCGDGEVALFFEFLEELYA